MANQSRYRDLIESVKPIATPERVREGKLRATSAIRPMRKQAVSRDFSRPIQSRRVLRPFALEDPDEARAVPESVFNGTILERIIYKRNLALYGPPGPSSWDTQVPIVTGTGGFGLLKLDFVYYRCLPPLVLEPQGNVWHDAYMDYLDAARAFDIEGRGYRYAEIFEQEILYPVSDDEVDRKIEDLVGNRLASYPGMELTLPLPVQGIIRPLRSYKETRRTF